MIDLKLFILALLPLSLHSGAHEPSQKFDFGPGPVAPGFTKVDSSTVFTPETGYGFLETTGISDIDRKTNDELARCVVDGIRDKVSDLAKDLHPHATMFDPSKPDAPSSIGIPLSPFKSIEKPAGS